MSDIFTAILAILAILGVGSYIGRAAQKKKQERRDQRAISAREKAARKAGRMSDEGLAEAISRSGNP